MASPFQSTLPEEYFDGIKVKPGYIKTYAPMEGLPLEYSSPGRKAVTGYRQGQKTTLVKGTSPFYIYKDPTKAAEASTSTAAPPEQVDEAPTNNTPQITPESQAYRNEADDILASVQSMLDAFKIDQATMASNLAMSQRVPNLQISPASQIPQTAGTQPFKRRRLMMQSASPISSSLNIGLSNSLNI